MSSLAGTRDPSRILIVGAGIAGPTLAFWLARSGMRPTLVEQAPALRAGGYVIDFWGAGYDIAERMGIVPEITRRGYSLDEVRMVGDRGERITGFGADVFRRITGGRYISLARSELSLAIFEQLDDRTERIFDEEVIALAERGEHLEVTLKRGGTRTFDLVIGADGLHSRVRSLVFGPQGDFEVFLGYEVAAFEVSGYRPRDEGDYLLHSAPGRQLGRFAMRGDRTLCLFVYASDGAPLPRELSEQKARVRAHFANGAWETDHMLAALDESDSLYIDRVSQTRMDRWTSGRVALVGDAAHCASLIAGQGSALAMVGATISPESSTWRAAITLAPSSNTSRVSPGSSPRSSAQPKSSPARLRRARPSGWRSETE
jgi:2-polyprenyl-6-methoxyphenol hydroxylase-like FAD-dependent oxidoreductase